MEINLVFQEAGKTYSCEWTKTLLPRKGDIIQLPDTPSLVVRVIVFEMDKVLVYLANPLAKGRVVEMVPDGDSFRPVAIQHVTTLGPLSPLMEIKDESDATSTTRP